MVNELIDLSKRQRKECLMLKFDLEKEYNCVSWNYLSYVMNKIGFGDKWLSWMEALFFQHHVNIGQRYPNKELSNREWTETRRFIITLIIPDHYKRLVRVSS